MTKNEEDCLLHWMQDKDVSEVMALLMKYGNRYSRRILTFFRGFCKWMPIAIMVFHAYGILEFGKHPREMFVPYKENLPCYLFIYFMLYIFPIVIIFASRFFYLCWRYRIPFFYFFGMNAVHIVGLSWYTTNDMVESCYTIMLLTLMFYLYGFAELFLTKSKIGKKICS